MPPLGFLKDTVTVHHGTDRTPESASFLVEGMHSQAHMPENNSGGRAISLALSSIFPISRDGYCHVCHRKGNKP